MAKYIILQAGIDYYEADYDEWALGHKAFEECNQFRGRTFGTLQEFKALVEEYYDIDWEQGAVTLPGDERVGCAFELCYEDMAERDEQGGFARATAESIEQWQDGEETLYLRQFEFTCSKLSELTTEDCGLLAEQGVEIN